MSSGRAIPKASVGRSACHVRSARVWLRPSEVVDQMVTTLAGHLAAILERGPALLGVRAHLALDGDLHPRAVAASHLARTVQSLELVRELFHGPARKVPTVGIG